MCIQKDKEQQSDIDKLEEEMLRIREKNHELKSTSKEMEQFKTEYMTVQKRLDEINTEFEDAKAEHMKESEAQKEEIESLNHKYSLLSVDFGKKTEELKLVATYTRALEAKHKDLETNIDTLTLQNEILQAVKEEHAMISEQLKETERKLEASKAENAKLQKQCDELDALRIKYNEMNKEWNDTTIKMEGLETEFASLYKTNKSIKQEKDAMSEEINDLNDKLKAFQKENALLNKRLNKPKRDGSTQTDFAYILEDAHLKSVRAENAYLNKEINKLIAERSKFKECAETDYHSGDICSMVVSPINHSDGYQVITGGKQDNSLRIWHPLQTTGSELTFVPKQKAMIDGNVLCVNMSDDGLLMAAGATLNNTVNGYVVIWNMKNDGKVLCNLRSRTFMRFGKVHCVQFMKFDENNNNHSTKRKKRTSLKRKKSSSNMFNKDKNAFNYLLFGGDTTGCILVWNLSSEHRQTPVCIISGHSDIIYDLSIVDNKWLFSVSHDQHLMYLDIRNFQNKVADEDNKSVDYVMSRKLFKDDSKYALKSIVYNKKSNELIFGSRKCNLFQLNDDNNMNGDDCSDDEKCEKYFESKVGLNTKDLDHINNLRLRQNLIAVQRKGINYVKVFDVQQNKFIKNYQIDDGCEDHRFKIYDCGISYDRKYAILCVGIFNKENLSNLSLSRSALKGFKIPKSKKTAQ